MNGGVLITGLTGLGIVVLLAPGVRYRLLVRREIEYARSVTRWLELGGDRGVPIEELWADLVFAAQRLGFSAVLLTMEDGQRVWSAPKISRHVHSSRRSLGGGGELGTMTLEAPAFECNGAGREHFGPARGRTRRSPGVSDPEVFEVLCTLLAESWMKTVRRWESYRRPTATGPPGSTLTRTRDG